MLSASLSCKHANELKNYYRTLKYDAYGTENMGRCTQLSKMAIRQPQFDNITMGQHLNSGTCLCVHMVAEYHYFDGVSVERTTETVTVKLTCDGDDQSRGDDEELVKVLLPPVGTDFLRCLQFGVPLELVVLVEVLGGAAILDLTLEAVDHDVQHVVPLDLGVILTVPGQQFNRREVLRLLGSFWMFYSS